jgi:CO dehydrogenase nickel-insertion accessory protein CooC1
MRVCWSVKGGVGTTVVSAVVALHRAANNDVRLVDLAGDLPATLGLPEPGHEGFGEWLANDAPLETIDHLALTVRDQLKRLGTSW